MKKRKKKPQRAAVPVLLQSLNAVEVSSKRKRREKVRKVNPKGSEVMNETKTRKAVRESYGKIAKGQSGCGCGPCEEDTGAFAKTIGYTDEELRAIPAEANLGLSCGNPTAIGNLAEGETVLDLGSGAGMDCFLAAKEVGPKGRIIGVDMTPEMIEKARENAERSGIENVEFRLGEIENLPLADASVDVVISNCVINLSTDKAQVFREVRRVLKPGGRIAISDMALTRPLSDEIRTSLEAYVGCVAGAVQVEEYKKIVEASGLKDVRVSIKSGSGCSGPEEGVVSIELSAHK